MHNLPSETWTSSMCTSVCLAPTQDTTSVIIAAGDTLDFSIHFYTDALMPGPDTGRVRIKFSNANSLQDPVYRMYKGITINNLSLLDNQVNQEKKLYKIIDLLGRETKIIPNQFLLYIYQDGSVEKKVFTSEK